MQRLASTEALYLIHQVTRDRLRHPLRLRAHSQDLGGNPMDR